MSRLVAVSNRVAYPQTGTPTGGLAVGVLAALKESGGLWFGWSGELTERSPRDADCSRRGGIDFATIELNADDFESYYNGFCNRTLWPLCHYMLGFFDFRRREYQTYLRVNELFARKLAPLLRDDDIVWVHDYHLIPLAAELRRAGVRQPLGFFLHVPFPDIDVLRVLPPYQEMLRGLCAYDVVGFQTDRDLNAFCEAISQPPVNGEVLEDGRVSAFGRTLRAGAFPIGIDVDQCQADAEAALALSPAKRLRSSLEQRKLIIGVDRLDYSKGLKHRFLAYERLLENYPENRGEVVFMQIAPPTRGGVRAYTEIRQELEGLSGRINGRFTAFDWVPLRYLNRGFNRSTLMGFFRQSRIGLVTPVRDGMNLVAKEYVAAQPESDPGVLVLSSLAGASWEMGDALIVNPYDLEDVAGAIQKGLSMKLPERQARQRHLLEVLRANDIHHWRRRFVGALQGVG